jgi:riboflavin synthase
MTVVNSKAKSFQVAVIPFTYEHTVFKTYEEGTIVNIEFDIIGKYITRIVKQVLGKE